MLFWEMIPIVIGKAILASLQFLLWPTRVDSVTAVTRAINNFCKEHGFTIGTRSSKGDNNDTKMS